MKPLLVLIGTFILSAIAIRIFRGNDDITLAGRIALAAMLCFTAIGHFAFTSGMKMMLPDFIPYKTETVYITGIIEIAAALGLFVPNIKVNVAWLLIAFFIAVLPANIYAALKHVDYQKATFGGPDLTYLWFRIPLQLLFISWTYAFAIKS